MAALKSARDQINRPGEIQLMLVMSGSLVKQELTVNYLLEPNGMVHEAWILTPAEAAEKRPLAKP